MKIGRVVRIAKTAGLHGLLELFRAKALRDPVARHIIYAALRGEAVRRAGGDRYLWRGRAFHVPGQLVDDFLSTLAVLWTYKLRGRYGVLVDVGGFLGETAWFFLTEGLARRVIVYEPAFYELALENVGDVAEVRREAVGPGRGTARLFVEGVRIRLAEAGVEVPVIPLEEALGVADAVKMDCEGCEAALLEVPCGALRAREYVVEVHPAWGVAAGPIVEKMRRCGLSAEPVATEVWRFYGPGR